MGKRSCIDCGRITNGTRCPPCQAPRTRQHDANYGPDYQAARRAILANNPPCHWCGAPATTADHDPPLAHGGNHNRMVPCCKPCNDARGGRTRR